MADEDLSTHWEETEGQTAKETAAATDNHFWWDTDGAHVSSTGDHDLSGANLLLTAAKLAFRQALVETATFAADLIELGKNSTSAVIKFCGGKASIGYNEDPQVQGYFTGSLTPASGARPSLWPMVSVRDDVVTMRGSTIKVGALNSDRTDYNSTTAPMANLASLVNLRVLTGSTIVTINSNGNAVLMSANAYQSQVGRAFSQESDMVFVMNGDTSVGDTTITAGYWPSDGNIWIHCGQITSRQVRINWMIVFVR